MRAKWEYNDDGTAYADGTGTYAAGWYAGEPTTIECGGEPSAGPFATRAAAAEMAATIAAAAVMEDVGV